MAAWWEDPQQSAIPDDSAAETAAPVASRIESLLPPRSAPPPPSLLASMDQYRAARDAQAPVEPVAAETEPDKPVFSVSNLPGALWDAGRGLVNTLPASGYRAYYGTDRPDTQSESAKAAYRKEAQFNQEMADKTAAAQAAGISDSTSEALREAGKSLGFTGISMAGTAAGGIGGGVLGSLASPGVGTAAGIAAGMAASGTLAYNMAANQFLTDAFDRLEAKTQKEQGRGLTEQEKQTAYNELLPIAQNTGLWEAGPESLGNAVSMGVGKFVFSRLGAKELQNIAAKAGAYLGKTAEKGVEKGGAPLLKAAAIGGDIAQELGMEGWTQQHQGNDQAQLEAYLAGKPLSEAEQPYADGMEGWWKGVKDVAPVVLATMGLMGGAGAIGSKVYHGISDRADARRAGETASQRADQARAALGAMDEAQVQAARDNAAQALADTPKMPKALREQLTAAIGHLDTDLQSRANGDALRAVLANPEEWAAAPLKAQTVLAGMADPGRVRQLADAEVQAAQQIAQQWADTPAPGNEALRQQFAEVANAYRQEQELRQASADLGRSVAAAHAAGVTDLEQALATSVLSAANGNPAQYETPEYARATLNNDVLAQKLQTGAALLRDYQKALTPAQQTALPAALDALQAEQTARETLPDWEDRARTIRETQHPNLIRQQQAFGPNADPKEQAKIINRMRAVDLPLIQSSIAGLERQAAIYEQRPDPLPVPAAISSPLNLLRVKQDRILQEQTKAQAKKAANRPSLPPGADPYGDWLQEQAAQQDYLNQQRPPIPPEDALSPTGDPLADALRERENVRRLGQGPLDAPATPPGMPSGQAAPSGLLRGTGEQELNRLLGAAPAAPIPEPPVQPQALADFLHRDSNASQVAPGRVTTQGALPAPTVDQNGIPFGPATPAVPVPPVSIPAFPVPPASPEAADRLMNQEAARQALTGEPAAPITRRQLGQGPLDAPTAPQGMPQGQNALPGLIRPDQELNRLLGPSPVVPAAPGQTATSTDQNLNDLLTRPASNAVAGAPITAQGPLAEPAAPTPRVKLTQEEIKARQGQRQQAPVAAATAPVPPPPPPTPAPAGSPTPTLQESADGLQAQAQAQTPLKPEAPPAQTGAGTPKEPWQMTRAEFENSDLLRGNPEYLKNKPYYDRRPDSLQDAVRIIHSNHVRNALAAGQPVPAEVLADYPELQSPKAPDTALLTFQTVDGDTVRIRAADWADQERNLLPVYAADGTPLTGLDALIARDDVVVSGEPSVASPAPNAPSTAPDAPVDTPAARWEALAVAQREDLLESLGKSEKDVTGIAKRRWALVSARDRKAIEEAWTTKTSSAPAAPASAPDAPEFTAVLRGVRTVIPDAVLVDFSQTPGLAWLAQTPQQFVVHRVFETSTKQSPNRYTVTHVASGKTILPSDSSAPSAATAIAEAGQLLARVGREKFEAVAAKAAQGKGKPAKKAAVPKAPTEPSLLSSYNQAELSARKTAEEKAAAAQAARDKAAADRARNDFVLSGSDRPADVAMARGQEDLLAGMSTAPAKPTAPAARPAEYGANNTLVSTARAEEVRKRLKAKLNQLNSGIDPELLALGTELAAYHLEASARKFVEFAQAMAADLETTVEKIRPFLRAWYNGARDMMEDSGLDVAAMDSPEQVKASLAEMNNRPAAPGSIITPSTPATQEQGDDSADTGKDPEDRGLGTGRKGSDQVPTLAEDRRTPVVSGTAGDRNVGESGDRTGSGRPGIDDQGATGTGLRPGASPGMAVSQRMESDSQQPPGISGRAGQGIDFRATPAALARTGSWLETAQRNIEIIELTQRLEQEQRKATAEEQQLLARYVGFGASEIRNPLFPTYGSPKGAWAGLRDRLEAALSPDELATLKQSTQYAHYTSPTVVQAMWRAMQRMGFAGGQILEPGMGVGHFATLMPDEIYRTSTYSGVEFDRLTAKIAQQLLQTQNIFAADYIKQAFPNHFFDLAIGNPPFQGGASVPYRSGRKHYKFSLHDFFFAKTLDKVRPGGMVAFITSSFTLDKLNDKARQFMAERADLIGAIRLPQTAFAQNAGTSVTTDVIFLRKRDDGAEPSGESWLGMEEITTPDGPVLVNEYYARHPEMVLGEIRIAGNLDANGNRINGLTPDSVVVIPRGNTSMESLDQAFQAAAERLPQGVYSSARAAPDTQKQAVIEREFNPKAQKEGQLYLNDRGDLMVRQDGMGADIQALAPKLTDAEQAWLKGYVGVREALNQARLSQYQGGHWEQDLATLNATYDRFVQQFGPITAFKLRNKKAEVDEDGEPIIENKRVLLNAKLMSLDVDSPLVRALEVTRDDGTIQKGRFLTERLINTPLTREVKTLGDALGVSLDSKGKLDLADVADRMQLSVEEAIEGLGTLIYQNPSQQGAWEMADAYLSGDVVAKLAEARAIAAHSPAYQRNVAALEKVQPPPLGPTQIRVKLGAPFVPADIVTDFLRTVMGEPEQWVHHDPASGVWTVSGATGKGSRTRRSASNEWGTEDRSALELLDNVLNNKTLVVNKTDSDKKTYTDQAATAQLNDVANRLRARFSNWVWTDTDHAARLLEIYNTRYNNLAPRVFDGSHLTLPGLTATFKPHPHQLRAVWRIIQTGNTYLGHAVGAGKTFEMIAAGMEQRRLGMIRRPMYVVPNHMLEQFTTEFQQFYPLANIMVADKENFHTENRRRFMGQVAMNDPDAVIITHSAFGLLKVNEESVKPLRDEILADLQSAIEDTGDKIARSKLEKMLEQAGRQFDRITNTTGKDAAVGLEDLGVDFLFVDEAHQFRKVSFVANLQVKGIDPQGSFRAIDLFAKTRILNAQRKGRAFVFASGTPVTNTMGELFTLQRFFDDEGMRRDSLHTFDSWATMFGEALTLPEAGPSGRYEPVTRFARFVNVPELMSRIRMFMDVLTADQLGGIVSLPELEGNKPNLVVTPATPELQAYMKNILEPRIEAAKKFKKSKDQPGNPDPLINIITDGRLAALDPRFFNPRLPKTIPSKLNTMIDGIIAEYKALQKEKFTDPETGRPAAITGATQMVFFNVGFGEQIRQGRGFDAKTAIMERLAKAGIPEREVAWFQDATTDEQKETIFRKMRSGELKILFGSAKQMGTGVNAQARLKVLHYFDPPWYPADVTQPHGRILRQGNQNESVRIHWYATKGTYDTTMWQMVARKQRFIDQALSGDASVRSLEDISEASQFEMAAALASGDQRIVQLATLTQEVERLSLLQQAHQTQQLTMRSEKRSIESEIGVLETSLIRIKEAAQQVPNYQLFKQGKVGQQSFTDKQRVELGDALIDRFNQQVQGNTVTKDSGPLLLGQVNGFEVFYQRNYVISPADLFVKIGSVPMGVESTSRELDVSSTGLITKIVNQINGIHRRVQDDEARIAAQKTQLKSINKKLGAPFEYGNELVEKTAERAQLQQVLLDEGQQQASEELAGAIQPDGMLPPIADDATPPVPVTADALRQSRKDGKIDTPALIKDLAEQVVNDQIPIGRLFTTLQAFDDWSERDVAAALRNAGMAPEKLKAMGYETEAEPGADPRRASNQRFAATTTPTTLTATLKSLSSDATVQGLIDQGRLKVVAQQTELPRHAAIPAGQRVAGWVDPETGSVYLVAGNITPAEVDGLLKHEIGVHQTQLGLNQPKPTALRLAHGLLRLIGARGLLGEPAFNDVLAQLERMRAAGNVRIQAAFAQADAASRALNQSPRLLAEEALAYLSGDPKNGDLSIIRRIIAAIRSFLYRAGFRVKLTEDDLHALAVSALRDATRNSLSFKESAQGEIPNIKVAGNASNAMSITKQRQGRINIPPRSADVTASDIILPQKSVNSSVVNAKLFGDFVTRDMLIDHGFDYLSIQRQRDVMSRMVAELHDRKVFDAVIQSIPIDVVNNLIGEKGSANLPFHDQSVFLEHLAVDPILPIRRSVKRFVEAVAKASSRIGTNTGAESSPAFDLTRKSVKFDAAMGTIKGRHDNSPKQSVVLDNEVVSAASLSNIIQKNQLVRYAYALGQAEPNLTAGEVLRRIEAGGEVTADEFALLQAYLSGATTATGVDAPTFKDWFGDSKIKNKAGKPLKMYHATAANFTVFDQSKTGTGTTHPTAALGFFFTNNRDHAATKYGANVMETYLAIERPYQMTNADLRRIDDADEARAFRKRLEGLGYDGIILPREAGTTRYVAAFYPDQIKLTDNETYTRGEKDVRYSYAGENAITDNALKEGTQEWADDAYARWQVPDGWYVHGRGQSQTLRTDQPIQMTKQWNVALSYGGRKDEHGSLWLIKPKTETRVFDFTDSDTEDANTVANKAWEDFTNGDLPFENDIINSMGNDVTEDDFKDNIKNLLAPKNIVDSAGFYDADANWINWLWDNFEVGYAETPDGAVALDRDSIDAIKINRDQPQRFALARPQPAPGTPPQLALPAMTRVEQMQRAIQDRFLRLKTLQNYFKQKGINLTPDADVYGAEERSVKRFAAKAEDFRNQTLKPLVQAAGKAGYAVTGGDLIGALLDKEPLPTTFKPSIPEYLIAQHAPERNASIAKINPAYPDGGSGLTNAQAAAIVAKYRALPGFAAFAQTAEQFRKISDETKKLLLNAGLLSADQVAAWDAAYTKYVPLMGGPEDAPSQQGTGPGQSVNARQHRALGHSLREENVLENIFRARERALLLIEKNEVGKAMRELLLQVNDPTLGTVGQPERKAVLAQGWAYEVWINGRPLGAFASYTDAKAAIAADSATTGRPVKDYGVRHKASDPGVIYMTPPQLAENEAAVYLNGERVRMQLNDPDVARAYNALGMDGATGLMKAGAQFNRWLSQAYTGYNPEFLFVNIVRDFTAGLINLTGQYGGGLAAAAAKNYLPAFRETWRYAREKGNHPWVDRYRAAGGSTGAAYLTDLERIGTDLKRDFQDAQGAVQVWQSGQKGAAVRVASFDLLHKMFGWMERLNMAGENAMRLATFRSVVEAGGSDAEAASAAANVTVNFNRRGEMGQQLSALYLFFNPNVQGTQILLDTLLNSPHKAQAWAAAGALVGLAYTLAALARAGDDDDERRWRTIPPGTRDQNMVIMTGTDTPPITIPVPFGYGAFWALGNVLSDITHGDERGKSGIRLASALFQHFSPIGNPLAGDEADVRNAVGLMPTAMKIPLEVAVNRNSLGAPIMPDLQPWNPGQPDSERKWRSSTGNLFDRLATGINRLTGGTPYTSGYIDVSPETFRKLWRDFFGGAGQFVVDSANLLTIGLQGATPTLRELPIARKFIRDETIQAVRTRFHDQALEVQIAMGALNAAKRAKDAAGVADLVREKVELLRLGSVLTTVNKLVRSRRELQMQINASDLPLPERRRLLKEVEAQEAQIYDRFDRLFLNRKTPL